jgi:hypothetical protein
MKAILGLATQKFVADIAKRRSAILQKCRQRCRKQYQRSTSVGPERRVRKKEKKGVFDNGVAQLL